MKKMKKIEVVINTLYLEHITNLLDKKGFSGYTVVKDVYGKGERGFMVGDEVTDVFKNSYLFTVCEEDKISYIIEDLRKILKKHGGICLISDVEWITH